MNRFPGRCTRVALTLVALAFVASGCSKGDAPPAPKLMPGALTKPIGSYTGDEFYDFVKTLQFSGGVERERKCKNDPLCDNTKTPKRTRVRVDAVATQDSISPSTTPAFGVVYIRAINKGDAEEARYGLAPGKHLEYYTIVLPDAAGSMKWQLEQLDTTPKSRRHTSVGSGLFQACNHVWVAGAKADFKTCANAAARHDSVVTLGLALQGVLDDPMWASCSLGCCIVNL